jgi:chemotaxis protein methyltransferase CheR
MELNRFSGQFTDIADACALAQAIVDTVPRARSGVRQGSARDRREPLVLFGFKVSPQDTQGRLLYELGDGQWDIPRLRVLLEKSYPSRA